MDRDTVPAGMKPWTGGDSAPDDWDGGPVWLADDTLLEPLEEDPLYWTRAGGEGGCVEFWCIVAYTPQASMEINMTDDQIKYMVSRFLAWKLPDTFNPDAGISFAPDFNVGTTHPMRHEPSGTNLFDAAQAEAMVRHMVAGLS